MLWAVACQRGKGDGGGETPQKGIVDVVAVAAAILAAARRALDFEAFDAIAQAAAAPVQKQRQMPAGVALVTSEVYARFQREKAAAAPAGGAASSKCKKEKAPPAKKAATKVRARSSGACARVWNTNYAVCQAYCVLYRTPGLRPAP